MVTKLEKELKREVFIGEKRYVVGIDPDGHKPTGKGRWKGVELKWSDLMSGEAELAVAPNASVAPG